MNSVDMNAIESVSAVLKMLHLTASIYGSHYNGDI